MVLPCVTVGIFDKTSFGGDIFPFSILGITHHKPIFINSGGFLLSNGPEEALEFKNVVFLLFYSVKPFFVRVKKNTTFAINCLNAPLPPIYNVVSGFVRLRLSVSFQHCIWGEGGRREVFKYFGKRCVVEKGTDEPFFL